MPRRFDAPSSSASPLSAASLSASSASSSSAAAEVVLVRVDHVVEAELLRGRLESAGIAARLTDTHTAGLGGHLSEVIGGIRVIVATDDLDMARALVDAPGADEALVDSRDPGLVGEDHRAVATRADVAARWALWSSLLGVVVPIGAHVGSLIMLWRAIDVDEPLSQRGRTFLKAAIAVDVVTLVGWGLLLS
jgi:hypothetical protein